MCLRGVLLLADMDDVSRHFRPQEALDVAIARYAARRHGVFTRTDAIARGASHRQIRIRVAAGRWEQLHRGIYRQAGAPATWRQALLAAVLSSGDDAVASHRAAARLPDLAGIHGALLEVSVPRGWRRRRDGILVHELVTLPRVDVTVVDAIPTTTVTRTLIDLAGVVSLDTLEEALDDALRRRLTTIGRLRWRLGVLARRGRPGIANIRSLLDARAPGDVIPQSVLETRFTRLLRRSNLPAPVRQHPIRGTNGKLVAVVDFAYVDHRLAVEIDGYRWHSGKARWEHDLERRSLLAALGWRVMHITAADLSRRPDDVVKNLTTALDRDAPPSLLVPGTPG